MKKIPLGRVKRGLYTIVSDKDYKRLLQWKWYLNAFGYVQRLDENKKVILMHRVILEAKTGEICDHRNGNRIDNRRSNLRICTTQENVRNRDAGKNSKSGFKGVSWDKNSQMWRAKIVYQRKDYILGYFTDIRDAIVAYNKSALKYHGEFARLNDLDTPKAIQLLQKHPKKTRIAKIWKTNTSGYIGVRRAREKWCATYKGVYLGIFTDKETAARAYNQAALEDRGDRALINVI